MHFNDALNLSNSVNVQWYCAGKYDLNYVIYNYSLAIVTEWLTNILTFFNNAINDRAMLETTTPATTITARIMIIK